MPVSSGTSGPAPASERGDYVQVPFKLPDAIVRHLRGLHHERLTWQYRGREFGLTEVHGSLNRPFLGAGRNGLTGIDLMHGSPKCR